MLNADVGTDSTNVACSSTLLILELLIPIIAMTAITAIAIPAGIAIFLVFVIPLVGKVFVPKASEASFCFDSTFGFGVG